MEKKWAPILYVFNFFHFIVLVIHVCCILQKYWSMVSWEKQNFTIDNLRSIGLVILKWELVGWWEYLLPLFFFFPLGRKMASFPFIFFSYFLLRYYSRALKFTLSNSSTQWFFSGFTRDHHYYVIPEKFQYPV